MPPDPGDPVIDYANGENRIINVGQAQLAALEARLAGVEKDRIAAHREAMKALLRTPGNVRPIGQCTTRGSDVPTNRGNIGDYTMVQPIARAHAAVIAQAFACGRATVRHAAHPRRLPELLHRGPRGPGVGRRRALRRGLPLPRKPRARLLGRGGRRARHVAQGLHRRPALGRHPLRRGARRVPKVPDPLDPNGGTMLDNTVIFWHSEFGHDGHDNQHMRHPVVIAGGGGRTLQARPLPAPAQHRGRRPRAAQQAAGQPRPRGGTDRDQLLRRSRPDGAARSTRARSCR